MTDQEGLSALEVALTNEKREREFYLMHAQRTRNPVGRAMFLEIADEELEHYERLQALHATWQKHAKWPESVPLKVRQTDVRHILVDVIREAGQAPPTDADDLAAIRTAIAFEEQGAAFYARLRDLATEPKVKQFFDLLASIENEHYLSLKDTEEYLTNPASWFTRTEHPHLNGA